MFKKFLVRHELFYESDTKIETFFHSCKRFSQISLKFLRFYKKKIHGAVHGWIHKMAHAHSGGTWFGRPSVNLLSYFVLHALPVFGGYSRIPFGHPEKGYGISSEASLGATFPCPAQGGAVSIGRFCATSGRLGFAPRGCRFRSIGFARHRAVLAIRPPEAGHRLNSLWACP